MSNNKPNGPSELPNIKKIIVVASGKGGVGKSTIAAGLALSLAKEGFRAGLLDADIYGPSVPTLFNLQNERPIVSEVNGKSQIVPFEKFGIKLISIGFMVKRDQAMLWRGPMASNGLKQLLTDTEWGELDFLVIDTPPGTGDIHITLIQQYKVDAVIIVTTPQAVALDDVLKAIGMFRSEHVNIPVTGIVENMAWFSPTKHPEEKFFIFGNGGGQVLSDSTKIPLIAQIPINEDICRLCDSGQLHLLFDDPVVNSGFDQILEAVLK